MSVTVKTQSLQALSRQGTRATAEASAVTEVSCFRSTVGPGSTAMAKDVTMNSAVVLFLGVDCVHDQRGRVALSRLLPIAGGWLAGWLAAAKVVECAD